MEDRIGAGRVEVDTWLSGPMKHDAMWGMKVPYSPVDDPRRGSSTGWYRLNLEREALQCLSRRWDAEAKPEGQCAWVVFGTRAGAVGKPTALSEE